MRGSFLRFPPIPLTTKPGVPRQSSFARIALIRRNVRQCAIVQFKLRARRALTYDMSYYSPNQVARRCLAPARASRGAAAKPIFNVKMGRNVRQLTRCLVTHAVRATARRLPGDPRAQVLLLKRKKEPRSLVVGAVRAK